MKILLLLLLSFPSILIAQKAIIPSRVVSIVDSTHANNMTLTQTFTVNVSLDSVWNAYTTETGWESWATAMAVIDFKLNGLIKTNYNTNGSIGDSTTITLHIINYIPNRMLTLQAELTKHFPDFMQVDEKDLFNIIVFEELSPNKTQVTSYGVGYKKNEDYLALMKFFIQGNEQSFLNLIAYLESGKPSVKY